jgi:NADH-quinone oxidoreductase subunit J
MTDGLTFAAVNWHSCLFLLYSVIACAFALGVLFSNNVVRMAAHLIVALAATAGLFMLAGAQFVGAMQIMIYVGGTLVLLIFGVMLTAQAAFVSMKTSAGEWVIAAVVGGSLLFLLVQSAFSVPDWRTPRADAQNVAAAETQAATPLGLAFLGVRVDQTGEQDAQARSGMSGYLLPFEIVSVHLLVVLIGAAYLARTKRRVTEKTAYESPKVAGSSASWLG